MTERLQQFNEGHSSKPSPNLSLTSSYSPNGTTLDNPLRFLGSQENHRILTRKTIYISFKVSSRETFANAPGDILVPHITAFG